MTNLELVILTNLFSILLYYAFIKSVLKRKAEKPLDYILIVVLYVLNALTVYYVSPAPKFIILIALSNLSAAKL